MCFSEPLVKLSATGLFFAAFPEESGPLVVTVTVLIFTRSVFFTSNYTQREQHLTHSHSQATIISFKKGTLYKRAALPPPYNVQLHLKNAY